MPGWAAELLRSLAPVAGYLRVQGAAEPDDLTSEVFIGVFRSLASFSGTEEQFRSRVFTGPVVGRRPRRWRRTTGEPLGRSAEHEALPRLSSEQVRGLCERLVPDQT